MPKLISYQFRDPIGTGTFPLANQNVNNDELEKRLSIVRKDKFKDTSVLYLHIPFCDSICAFCALNRFVSTDEKKEKYLKSLEKEMQYYSKKPYIQSLSFKAIYIGGGTPTSLSPEQLDRFLGWIRKYFDIQENCEITIEGTTHSFTNDMVAVLKKHQVNRISTGIQSFNGKLRKRHLNMKYEKEEVIELLKGIKSNFENFNVDLIYNLPEQTMDMWKDDLNTVINVIKPKHLTMNPYVLLQNTKIHTEVQKGTYHMPDMGQEIDMFNEALSMLENTPLHHHYSVRDWTTDGDYCRYIVLNSYSNDVLGLGAGGFGYLDGISYKNYENLEKYNTIASKDNESLMEKYILCTTQEKMQRYMVMGMRLQKLNMQPFIERFEADWKKVFGDLLEDLEYSGFIKIEDNVIQTLQKGKVWGNNMRAEFSDNENFTYVGYGLIGAGKSGRGNYL